MSMSDRIRLRNEKDVTIKGKNYLQIPIFTFDELSEESQERALETQRNVEHEIGSWMQDNDENFKAKTMNGVEVGDVFDGIEPSKMDLRFPFEAGYPYVRFDDFDIKDHSNRQKFAKFAGISKRTNSRLDDIDFGSEKYFDKRHPYERAKTVVTYIGNEGHNILLDVDRNGKPDFEIYSERFDNRWERDVRRGIKYDRYKKTYKLNKKEFEEASSIKDTIDVLLEDAEKEYIDGYKNSLSDEVLKENLIENKFKFDTDGSFIASDYA